MSCHSCAAPFGFLKKEIGCPRCGYSYCRNCLRYKVPDETQKKTISICQGCYSCESGLRAETQQKLTRQWKETATIIHAVRRLESMENPAKPPITVYRESNSGRLLNLQKGLSVEDQKIVERLKELRSSHEEKNLRRKSEPTEEEVAARLARLRGEVPELSSAVSSSSGILLKQKPETDEELLNRLTQQVDIEKMYDAKMTGDINERLAKLRGRSKHTTSTVGQVTSTAQLNLDLDEIMDEGTSEEITDEEQIQRIINQFVEEVALEEKLASAEVEGEPEATSSKRPQSDPESEGSDDVDTLCRICDEKRATLKCKECDDDIFCKGCFKEFHIELGEYHKATPFSSPR